MIPLCFYCFIELLFTIWVCIYSANKWVHILIERYINIGPIDYCLLPVGVLNLVHADVGLPAVSEQLMGLKEVRGMVQLTLRILAEPYSKSLCTSQGLTIN